MDLILEALPPDLLPTLQTAMRDGRIVYVGLTEDLMSVRLSVTMRDPATGSVTGTTHRMLRSLAETVFADLCNCAGTRMVRLSTLVPIIKRNMSNALIDLSVVHDVRVSTTTLSRKGGGSALMVLDKSEVVYGNLLDLHHDDAIAARRALRTAAATAQNNPSLADGQPVVWEWADATEAARVLALLRVTGAADVPPKEALTFFVSSVLQQQVDAGLFSVREETQLPHMIHSPLRFAIVVKRVFSGSGTARDPYLVRLTFDATELLKRPLPITDDKLQALVAEHINTATF
jgi:hypothetical protein